MIHDHTRRYKPPIRPSRSNGSSGVTISNNTEVVTPLATLTHMNVRGVSECIPAFTQRHNQRRVITGFGGLPLSGKQER